MPRAGRQRRRLGGPGEPGGRPAAPRPAARSAAPPARSAARSSARPAPAPRSARRPAPPPACCARSSAAAAARAPPIATSSTAACASAATSRWAGSSRTRPGRAPNAGRNIAVTAVLFPINSLDAAMVTGDTRNRILWLARSGYAARRGLSDRRRSRGACGARWRRPDHRQRGRVATILQQPWARSCSGWSWSAVGYAVWRLVQAMSDPDAMAPARKAWRSAAATWSARSPTRCSRSSRSA